MMSTLQTNLDLEALAQTAGRSGVGLPRLVTEIPGPRSRQVTEAENRLNAPGGSAASMFSGVAFDAGYDTLVRDVDGNVYIDFCAGTVVVNTGHSHPRVVAALETAARKLIHLYDFTTETRLEFFTALKRLLPESLSMFHMLTVGTEAVDAAMRLARAYTGRSEFISLYRGYHGRTYGAMSLMGGMGKKRFGPLLPGCYQTPNAYCYRCPLGHTYPQCGVACASAIDTVFDQASTGDLAAVIVEPIQGAGGVIVPPPGFLEYLRAFCDRHGALLIFDEILTSAGRTGKLWAFEHSGVVPDILIIGKGIASGYPISALASRPEIMAAEPWAWPTWSSSTFGGSPLASAAGIASLGVLVDEDLAGNAARVGAWMKQRLQAIQQRHWVIGDVRGVGLLLGVEFVRDPQRRTPILPAEARFFFTQLLRRGLLTSSVGAIVRLTPPLTLTQGLAARGLDLFEEAVGALEAHIEASGDGGTS